MSKRNIPSRSQSRDPRSVASANSATRHQFPKWLSARWQFPRHGRERARARLKKTTRTASTLFFCSCFLFSSRRSESRSRAPRLNSKTRTPNSGKSPPGRVLSTSKLRQPRSRKASTCSNTTPRSAISSRP